jgi:hypothetical protein
MKWLSQWRQRLPSNGKNPGGEKMAGNGGVYDKVESIVAKLFVLRDSCTGVIHKGDSTSNLIWFHGAETILKEAVDELQTALRSLEEGS